MDTPKTAESLLRHETLIVEDIMQSALLFHDEEEQHTCLEVCRRYGFRRMPDADLVHFWEREGSAFSRREITSEDRLETTDRILGADVIERFIRNGDEVLFVTDRGLLQGVVHASDYNKAVVLAAFQEDLLSFERRLRQLVMICGRLTASLLAGYVRERAERYPNHWPRHLVERIQWSQDTDEGSLVALQRGLQLLTLSQLFEVADRYGAYSVRGRPREMLVKLRNMAMHGRDMVSRDESFRPGEERDEVGPVYDLSGLIQLVKAAELLRTEHGEVGKRLASTSSLAETRRIDNQRRLRIIEQCPEALDVYLGIHEQ